MPSSAGKKCADRKSTRLNSSHTIISYAVFCLKKNNSTPRRRTPTPAPPPTPTLAAPPLRHAQAVGLVRRDPHPRRVPVRRVARVFFFLSTGAPPSSPLFPPPAGFQ